MKINNLHYVACAVNDFNCVQDFWKKLGFTLLGNEKNSFFWIGGVQIQLHSTMPGSLTASWRARHKRDDLYQICLEVENLDEAMNELKAKGVKFSDAEESEQGKIFFIDPKYTGEYYLGLIELNEKLKHKTISEQQEILARESGGENLTSEKISYNDLGITNIHHMGISVADYERAKNLWQNVLGFDALYQHFKERDFKEDAMYIGDAQIHLYRSDNPSLKFCWWPRENGDGIETLSVCVENINRTIKALRVTGMDIAGEGPESMSQGMDVFIDKKFTGGNDFELVELHYFLRGKTVEQQKKIVYHFFGEGTVL